MRIKWVTLGIFLILTSGYLSAFEFQPGQFYASGPKDKKMISLTFDDGPGPHTEKFLALLDEYNVKATFFMNGKKVEQRPEIAKKVKNEGHEIGCHTWDHINYNNRLRDLMKENTSAVALKMVKKELREDIKRTQSMIEKVIDHSIFFLRMPHGIDRPWIKEVAKETGFVIVNWTLGADWTKESIENLEETYRKAVRPGAILLFHDGWGKSSKSLTLSRAALEEAKEKGYKVVPLGELLGRVP